MIAKLIDWLYRAFKRQRPPQPTRPIEPWPDVRPNVPVNPLPDPTPTPNPQPEPEPEFPAYALELLKLHNKERSVPLKLNRKLQAAADKHAQWMAENRRMSHTGAGRSSHGDRIRAENYKPTYTAENVAWNQKSEAAVMSAWMRSRGHRRNITNNNLTECGLAMHNDGNGPYWCAVFARPAQVDAGYNYTLQYPEIL